MPPRRGSPALIGSQEHDFKLASCVTFAIADWKTQEPNSTELKIVLARYRFNVSRVRGTMTVPAQVGVMASDIQRWSDIAEFQLFGTVDTKVTEDQANAIEKRIYELSREETEPALKLQGSAAWDELVRHRLALGGRYAHLVASSAGAAPGINSLLGSYITGAWTAFEAMSSDLWETALNTHPASLAGLNGDAQKFRKKSKINDSGDHKPQPESKAIPLKWLQEHNFDVKYEMGSLLKSRFDFGRLAGIRDAYGCAFAKSFADVQTALMDDSLDALSAVRNLLVHKAGIPDAEYHRRTRGLAVPTSQVGPVLLDGDTVVELIKPALNRGAELITAVDDWLQKH